jgi:hypothetical protein
MSDKKRRRFSFDEESPTTAFLSIGEEKLEPRPQEAKAAEKADKTERRTPKPPAPAGRMGYRGERRSKRLNLLVTPSLYKLLVAKAKAAGTSVNDLINVELSNLLSRQR